MALKKYEGVLERLGTGEFANNSTAKRYDVVVVGGQDIRNVAVGGYVNSFLDVGKHVTLFVGRMYFMKYIYAARTEQGLKKMPWSWLVGSAAVRLAFTFILLTFGGLLPSPGGLIMLAVVAYMWFRFVQSLMDYSSIN